MNSMKTPLDGLQAHVHPHVTAALQRAGLDDWMPEGEGKWSLALQFLPEERGWVELMRLAPDTKLTLQRHQGEVHGLNQQGSPRLDDGRIINAGDYVFKPDGHVDSWEAVGDEVLVLHVVVRGDVDYVGRDGAVQRRITTADRIADCVAFCAVRGRHPRLARQADAQAAGITA